jgi:hypothetical protein
MRREHGRVAQNGCTRRLSIQDGQTGIYVEPGKMLTGWMQCAKQGVGDPVIEANYYRQNYSCRNPAIRT